MQREELKKARKANGMTQQAVADSLYISLRHYKKIESGKSLGSIAIWDSLEKLFNQSQMSLRLTSSMPSK